MRWMAALLSRFRRRAAPAELIGETRGVLEERIGYRFRNPDLLVQALKHRSYVYSRQQHGIAANERLEYLGDAVLDLVVAEYLFHRFPDKREGDLTEMKSLAVSRAVLSRKARNLDLGRFVLLSADERQAGGGRQPSILSDAFEAVIGAIYLDGGLEASRRFIDQAVLDDFGELLGREDFVNFKSKLLEHTQSVGCGHPRYQVHAEEGPDHCKEFSVEVQVTGQAMGHGRGRSKKEAQQMAAKDALERLGAR